MNSTLKSDRLLIDGFLESVQQVPDAPALDVEGRVYTYSELAVQAGAIAETINKTAIRIELVGVLAHNSLTAYAGILGSLISGSGYVPLQPEHPIERIARSMDLAELEVVVAGTESIECLKQLLPALSRPITVILPDVSVVAELMDAAERHQVISADGIARFEGDLVRPENAAADIAYVIFTSGSTGMPKGVPVRNCNVVPFVQYMKNRCQATSSDRFSQISDLTFDLSIFPVWTCWESGACLCSVSNKDRLAPANFIRNKQITVWTSVPSAAVLLKRMRLLKPGSFPSIRYSFFCGEPLSSESAKNWQAASPHSIVENMYGPSEATCAITWFTWADDDSRCANGIVPIGWPYETQRAAIVDGNFDVVAAGQEGELCLAGSQVVSGYMADREKTKEKFIRIPALGDDVWYRTGDLACQAADGCYFFRGRIDFQVKVLGHRIELQEVEQVIRQAAQSEMAVCLPWPIVDGAPQGLVGFVAGAMGDCQESCLLKQCELSLPEYMVPRRIHLLTSLPLNSNGKIDRAELIKILDEGRLE